MRNGPCLRSLVCTAPVARNIALVDLFSVVPDAHS